MNTPWRRLNAWAWAAGIAWILDFLAMAALAGTSEVHSVIWLMVGTLLLLRQIPAARLSLIPQMVAFIALVLASLAACFILHLHPIVVAAHAAPIAHCLLWFSDSRSRYWGWRLGMGFVELIVASALTTEFYLFFIVFSFVILASVAIGCAFLSEELGTRAPEVAAAPLPRAFIRKSLAQAWILFLTSAVIFPILPRVDNDGLKGPDQSHVGFTEEVNVSEWTRLSGQTGGTIALRFFPPPKADLLRIIPFGLIRAKTLDFFDGKSWAPIPGRLNRSTAGSPLATVIKEPSATVEVLREPIGSDSLPTPYGTFGIKIQSPDGEFESRPALNGEWLESRSKGRRVSYTLKFLPNHFRLLSAPGSEAEDAPRSVHTYVPPKIRTERMERLAKKLTQTNPTSQLKVDAVLRHFRNGGYSVTGEETSTDQSFEEAYSRDHLSALENFLFIRKQGHCEFFASGAAVLLRMMGVPTRLIAGFRISKAGIGGVVTVRSSDAHAWLEAYVLERGGWIPIDPTPRVVVGSSAIDFFRDGYELLSNYWYRYILTYTELSGSSISPSGFRSFAQDYYRKSKEGWKNRMFDDLGASFAVFGSIALSLACAILLILRLWFPHLLGLRRLTSEGTPSLKRERRKFDRLIQLNASDLGLETVSGIRDRWQALYDFARFGRPVSELDDASLAELASIRSELRQAVKNAKNSRAA